MPILFIAFDIYSSPAAVHHSQEWLGSFVIWRIIKLRESDWVSAPSAFWNDWACIIYICVFICSRIFMVFEIREKLIWSRARESARERENIEKKCWRCSRTSELKCVCVRTKQMCNSIQASKWSERKKSSQRKKKTCIFASFFHLFHLFYAWFGFYSSTLQLAFLPSSFECVSICLSMHMKNCLDLRFKYTFTFIFILHANIYINIYIFPHTLAQLAHNSFQKDFPCSFFPLIFNDWTV